MVPSPQIAITLSGPIRSYTVKENQIGSAVSEILRYRQTDKDPVILLLEYASKCRGNVLALNRCNLLPCTI